MLLFQTQAPKSEEGLRPVSWLSLVPHKTQSDFFVKRKGGEFGVSTGYSMLDGFSGEVSYNKRIGNLQISPAYKLRSGSKVLDFGNLGVESWVGLPDGGIAYDYYLATGSSIRVMGRHGIGLSYDRLVEGVLEGNARLSLSTQGGPGGNTYSVARFISEAKTGTTTLGTILGAVKAGVDAAYSIYMRAKEWIWPSIPERTGVPAAPVLEKIRSGSGSIQECLTVLSHSSCLAKDRQKAGARLEQLLLSDLYAAKPGEQKLGVSDWEALLPILKKNSAFLSSTGFAQIRCGADCLKMTGGRAAGPLDQLASSGWAGSLAAGTLSSLFSPEEMSIGVPLNLQYGWDLEGVFDFKKTKEANGWLGKIWGAIQDVVNIPLAIAGNVIGSVSPIYRRSDVRREEARASIEKAIGENEMMLSGREASGKALYSNLIYLRSMLSLLPSLGEESLAQKISSHFGKHLRFYEGLSATVMHAETMQIISDLESGKYSRDPETQLVLRERLAENLSRLIESYLYLTLSGEGKQGASEFYLKFKAKQITELFLLVGKKQKAELEAINSSKLSKGKSVFPMLVMPDGQAIDWKAELVQASDSVQALGDGKVSAWWGIVAKAIREGKGPHELGGAEKDAAQELYLVAGYSQRYGVIGEYLQQWAGRQGQKEGEAVLQLLAANTGQQIREMSTALFNSLDWFARVSRLFPNAKTPSLISTAGKEIDKQLELLGSDLKSSEDEKQFVEKISFLAAFLHRLAILARLSDDGEKIAEWGSQMKDAVDTLSKLSEKSKLGSGAAYQDLCDAWYSIYQCSSILRERCQLDLMAGMSEEQKSLSFHMANRAAPQV